MSDMLRFMWIAFREYWATWVTGTGMVGFSLWLLNIYDKRRAEKGRKPMSWKTNVLILFCTFWFLATFSAWHDADKNLRAVIKQREQDTGALGQCEVDLKAEQSKSSFFDQQARAEQTVILGMQQNVNTQVGALAQSQKEVSELVKEFAKLPALQPERVVLHVAGIADAKAVDRNGNAATLWAIVATPTKPISPVHGVITCSKGFSVGAAGNISGSDVTMMSQFGLRDAQHFEFRFTSPVWTSANPIVIVGETQRGIGIGNCSYEDAD